MSDYRKRCRQLKIINVVLLILLIACLVIIGLLLMRQPEQMPEQQNDIPVHSQEAATEATATAPVVQETTQVPDQTTASGETVPEETVPEETAPEETEPAADDAQWIWIETPYISLGYPSQWESYLRYEHMQAQGVYTVAFCCSIEQEQIPLFDVHFGREEEGEFLGYLQTEDGTVPVSVTFHDYMPDDSWREDDTYVLFAMQEAVNDLIGTIRGNSSFTQQ